MTPQLQRVETRLFNHLADETIHTILSFSLVRQEPIDIGIRPVDPPFSEGCSLLRVSRRFHRIAEHIIYHSNTFRVWDSDLWLWDFLTGLSMPGRRMVTKLRIQWPDRLCPNAPQEILELIASCAGLARVEFFCFPVNMALSNVRQIASLRVNEIWFETSSCRGPPDLAMIGGKRCSGSRERMVSIQRSG
jgi:hypothetical protein